MRAKRRPRDVLHGKESEVFVSLEPIHPHDVRVRHSAEDTELSREALEAYLVASEEWVENLESYDRLGSQIERSVYGGSGTDTDALFQVIAASEPVTLWQAIVRRHEKASSSCRISRLASM